MGSSDAPQSAPNGKSCVSVETRFEEARETGQNAPSGTECSTREHAAGPGAHARASRARTQATRFLRGTWKRDTILYGRGACFEPGRGPGAMICSRYTVTSKAAAK